MKDNNNSQTVRQAQAVRGSEEPSGSRRGEKGFAMPMIIVIIALVVIGVGYFATRTNSSPAATTETPTGEKTLPDGGVIKADGTTLKPEGKMEKKDGETTMKKDDGAVMPARSDAEQSVGAKYTGTILAGKSAPLIDYNKVDYNAAIKSDKLIVLYFYANWCPICKNETANALYPEFNELTSDKVVGFRVNYNDSDTDGDEKTLARQFGVAYQHTKVFVKSGQRILKSPEGWDQSRYDMEINKALTE